MKREISNYEYPSFVPSCSYESATHSVRCPLSSLAALSISNWASLDRGRGHYAAVIADIMRRIDFASPVPSPPLSPSPPPQPHAATWIFPLFPKFSPTLSTGMELTNVHGIGGGVRVRREGKGGGRGSPALLFCPPYLLLQLHLLIREKLSVER